MPIKKINNIEHQYQCAVIQYLELHPKKPLFYAIPNGGLRNKIVAAKLKKEGVKPGVPDICICEPKGDYHAFYIEMKSPNGKISLNQTKWNVLLNTRNYLVAICYSIEDAVCQINNYLNLEK